MLARLKPVAVPRASISKGDVPGMNTPYKIFRERTAQYSNYSASQAGGAVIVREASIRSPAGAIMFRPTRTG